MTSYAAKGLDCWGISHDAPSSSISLPRTFPTYSTVMSQVLCY